MYAYIHEHAYRRMKHLSWYTDSYLLAEKSCTMNICMCDWILAFQCTLKLIAFELAGEDRERRENPVVSRLKIAFYALHKRG